jgi:3-methyladenine DNA glycosylase/8-oxoguanine DNA glycosylase
MTNSPTPMVRRIQLARYLKVLIRDIAAQGKITKINGNPVEVAAVAIMSGSLAVVQAMWEDIAALTGNAGTDAINHARPMLENIAARGVGLLFDKLLGARK